MKFNIFFLFFYLVFLVAESNSSNPQKGFYVGILAGSTHINTKYDLDHPAGPASASYEAGKSGLNGGGMVGYHLPFENTYIEAEIYALYQNNTLRVMKDGNPAWNGMSVSLKKNYVYGFAGLVGAHLYDSPCQASIYLRLGVENGNYKFTILESGPVFTYADAKKTKQVFSFAPGIGLKIVLKDNLFIRTDYTYVHTGSSVRLYAQEIGGATSVKHKFSPQEHRFMVSLAYQF